MEKALTLLQAAHVQPPLSARLSLPGSQNTSCRIPLVKYRSWQGYHRRIFRPLPALRSEILRYDKLRFVDLCCHTAMRLGLGRLQTYIVSKGH